MALAVLLSGCTDLSAHRAIAQRTPAVEASSGGDAELSLLACPPQGDAQAVEQALHRLLAELEQEGVLVTADGGNARLTINLCQ